MSLSAARRCADFKILEYTAFNSKFFDAVTAGCQGLDGKCVLTRCSSLAKMHACMMSQINEHQRVVEICSHYSPLPIIATPIVIDYVTMRV